MEIIYQIKRLRSELNHLRNRFNKFINQTATSEVPGAVKLYNSLEDEHEDGAPTQKLVRDLKAELDTFKDGFRAGLFSQEGLVDATDFEITFQVPMPNAQYSVALTTSLTRPEISVRTAEGFTVSATAHTGDLAFDWQVQSITEGGPK